MGMQKDRLKERVLYTMDRPRPGGFRQVGRLSDLPRGMRAGFLKEVTSV